MVRKIKVSIVLLALGCVTAWADVPIGYVSWDVSFPGNAGAFDITNLTGPNAAPTTFPVTTTVSLSDLSLVVNFVGGGSTTYGPSYFTLGSDGESFNGTAIPIGGTNPEPTSATLTGTFSPLSILDPVADTINSTFSATFSDTPNLVDGDFAVIYATEGTASTVPEPNSLPLLAIIASLLLLRAGKVRHALRSLLSGGRISGLAKGVLPVLCLVAISPAAFGQLELAASTSPSSGTAGITNVNVTASDVPSGTVTPANIVASFATSCGGTAVQTEAANSVRKILGSTDRVNINIPTGLTSGTYFVTLADSTGGDANFTSLNCSAVQVTASTAVLNACLAGSSLGVLLPANGATGNVTAYVPQGWWGGGNAGVFVKNIEGTLGPGTSIATANIANSCSSNPATGQTVCVANNTDVYLISGTTLNTTLTSGAARTTSFSGGSCANCGVAINANNNTAVINMGISGSPSGGGVQILNLANNTFGPTFPMSHEVSENISVDPTRSLIVTAGEDANFTLLQLQPGGGVKEFGSSFSTGIENDSSAEDCATGVALTPGEFSNSVYLVNLNDITFGTSTYTAPNALATLSTSEYSFAAGLSASAVAQGSGHLAVVTGEFGGNTFAVLQLPAAASTATPAVVDYAIAQIPNNTACGGSFSAGFDPHTVTAYTSPNGSQDSFAVFAGYNGSVPRCLAVVDMTMIINSTVATRGGGGFGAHEISPANFPAAAVKFFTLP